jgi:hypothetical protein
VGHVRCRRSALSPFEFDPARVAGQGSTIFALPDHAVLHAIAPAGTGLLASDISPTKGRLYEMNRFGQSGVS